MSIKTATTKLKGMKPIGFNDMVKPAKVPKIKTPKPPKAKMPKMSLAIAIGKPKGGKLK